jgi:hypothetical protein
LPIKDFASGALVLTSTSMLPLPAIAPQALPQSPPQEDSQFVKKAEQANRDRMHVAVYRARQHTRVAAQAAPESPVQLLRDVFLGITGSTVDLRCPDAEQQPNAPAAGLRPAIQQPA